MSTSSQPLGPGAYKFTVKSTAEAVALIRERLGPTARVLSVRPVEARGWRRLFAAPRLEVVAQVDAPASRLESVSSETAAPSLPELRAAGMAPGATARRTRQNRVTGSLGLSGLLRRSGVSESTLLRLESHAGWAQLTSLPLHRALAETSSLLRAQAGTRAPRAPVSRAAFLGTAGVGRTTALCKWMSVDICRRARLGHVVSVEFDRPNPLGPLPVFAEALGVPLAHFPCATEPAVPGGFVYFDLPPLSFARPADNATLAAWLDRESIRERVLVLNAAYDRATLRESYAAGRDLGATHLVFTHLDEVPQWGKLWDYLFDEEVEPLFLATGPSLTGDCEEDVPAAIARRTLPDDETPNT
jgi:flagellar biosynthesis protein FlhF